MITKMGNASAIRKSFMAFKTAFVTNPFVVMSFEGKIDPDACNSMAMQFGRYLSTSAMCLPQGVFNLSDAFYETDSITVRVGKDFRSYVSVGAYADSLNCGDEDYLNSERWLGVIAELFSEAFLNENIPFPSKADLERMFVVGDNYTETQKGLQRGFSAAKEMDRLEDILLDVMSEYHKKFAKFAAEELIKDGSKNDAEAPINRIYSMLPFEIVSHVSVGSIYDGILPIILASNVSVDQDKLFHKRIERGRAFLEEFAGKELDEGDALGVLAKAIAAKSKDLQPLMPGYLVDCLRDEGVCAQLAQVLCLTILSDELFEAMPTL